MKKVSTRGMRDIPTIQGLRHRGLPTTREQAVAEIARMEHERARLQRELEIWLSNQEKTQSRLRQVEERLACLQEIFDPPVGNGQAKRRAQGTQTGLADDGEGETRSWREIPLEY
jgi:hypothetical protein